MKRLLILFFLTSCSTTNSNVNLNNIVLNFDDNLNFDDFKELLIQYVEISPYPNIDK